MLYGGHPFVVLLGKASDTSTVDWSQGITSTTRLEALSRICVQACESNRHWFIHLPAMTVNWTPSHGSARGVAQMVQESPRPHLLPDLLASLEMLNTTMKRADTGPLPLLGELALVTGSSRGLGCAIAQHLHAQGADVIINYKNASSHQMALDTAANVSGYTVCADVTDLEAVKKLFDDAESHHGKPITIVVNSALASFSFNGDARQRLDELSWEAFDSQMKGALQGALNTTKAAMMPGRSVRRIINIGSNLVQNPVVPYHDYIASKGALLAFTRSCAAELGPRGITVNMVSGGLLRVTDASRATPDEVFDQVQAVTPTRRVTSPEDVAAAVAFFASPVALQVTGQDLRVDGGLVMS
jgi:3-oxoacyl-[acyl-carrier protein] reductase